MLLDRIFGVLAVVAFVTGAAGHLELLLGWQTEPKMFDVPLVIFWWLAITVCFYVVGFVGKRDQLEYTDDGLALWPLTDGLPKWVKAITIVVLAYTLLLGALVAYWSFAERPLYVGTLQDLAATEHRIRANGILLTAISAFTGTSFLFAAYLLLKPQVDAD